MDRRPQGAKWPAPWATKVSLDGMCVHCGSRVPCLCSEVPVVPMEDLERLFAIAIRASRQPIQYLSAWLEAQGTRRGNG